MKKYLSNGHLFKCTKEAACLNVTNGSADKIKRKVIVEKGEIVEFRYAHDVHFRTTDGLYLFMKEDEFLSHFQIHGKVFEQIRFNNKNTTKQIVECELYEPVEKELLQEKS